MFCLFVNLRKSFTDTLRFFSFLFILFKKKKKCTCFRRIDVLRGRQRSSIETALPLGDEPVLCDRLSALAVCCIVIIAYNAKLSRTIDTEPKTRGGDCKIH